MEADSIPASTKHKVNAKSILWVNPPFVRSGHERKLVQLEWSPSKKTFFFRAQWGKRNNDPWPPKAEERDRKKQVIGFITEALDQASTAPKPS